MVKHSQTTGSSREWSTSSEADIVSYISLSQVGVDTGDIPLGMMMLRTIMISLMNNVMTYYLPLICLSDVHQAAPVTSQISAHMISELTNNIWYFYRPMWTGNGLNDQWCCTAEIRGYSINYFTDTTHHTNQFYGQYLSSNINIPSPPNSTNSLGKVKRFISIAKCFFLLI